MDIEQILLLIERDPYLSALNPPRERILPKPRVNPFLLISDKFQKENLHSEIIMYLLDPKSDHLCDDKFLRLFIEYLGFSNDDFIDPTVTMEEWVDGGRMDLCISGKATTNENNAIIIENKINAADDTTRQLPTYYNELTQAGFLVKAIVYLSLEGYKATSTIGWTDYEIDAILPIIKNVGAYQSDSKDLVNGWLEKCRSPINEPDVDLFLKHYIDLLKFRRGNIMNEKDLNDLFNFIKGEENRVKIDYLVTLYNNVGEIMAKHLCKRWDETDKSIVPTPFKHCVLYNYNKSVCFSAYIFNNEYIKFTVDFPANFQNPTIRLRFFAEGGVLPVEISRILETFLFKLTEPTTNEMVLHLEPYESMPANEVEIFQKIFDIHRALHDISPRTLA